MHEVITDIGDHSTPEVVPDQDALREARNIREWHVEALDAITPATSAETLAELIARAEEIMHTYNEYLNQIAKLDDGPREHDHAELQAERQAFLHNISHALLRYTSNANSLPTTDSEHLTIVYDTLLCYHRIIESSPDLGQGTIDAHHTLLLSPTLLDDAPTTWHQAAYTRATVTLMPNVTKTETTENDAIEREMWQAKATDILSHAWPTDREEIGMALGAAFYKVFGHRTEDILSAWDTCTAQDNRQPQTEAERKQKMTDFMRQNLESLANVWQEAGAEGVFRLHDTYGIRHFGRYDPDLLTAQALHQRETTPTKEYVVVLYPFEDHNGAFYQQQEVFVNLIEQLEETHHIVITESAHRRELLRRLTIAHREYGGDSGHPADMVLLGAHGSAERMSFGESVPSHQITKEDLTNQTPPPGIDRVISKQAPIVVISCSTGKDDGVAERAAATFGRPVIAPDKPTNLTDIEVTLRPDGHIGEAYPTYNASKARTFYFPANQSRPRIVSKSPDPLRRQS